MVRYFTLVWVALALRLQPWMHFPKYTIVYLELALLLIFYWVNRERLGEFFIRFARPLRLIAIGLGVGLVWAALEVGWDRVNGFSSPIYWQSLIYLPVALIVVGWASALYEELLFRSALLWYFNRLWSRPSYAILAQAGVFFLAHSGAYFHGGHWHTAVVTVAFGLAMGVLTWRTKSVLPAWVAHAFSNSYAVIFIRPDLVLERILSSWSN